MKDNASHLYALGAHENDIDTLWEYTKNVFVPCPEPDSDDFLEKWKPVFETAGSEGVTVAVNRHLVKEEFRIAFNSPETLRLELFPSAAGDIPVISTGNADDFESMVRNIIYRGADVPHAGDMGASFAYGKSNRFIILSNKPYSGVSAERMGLDDEIWRAKSMAIRRHHECAHYYTKRFFGSSRNNLHDELIADFCGIYAAFGEYRAEWFLNFIYKRINLYVKDVVTGTALKTIENLADEAANGVEAWSKTPGFAALSEAERIRFLCSKDLLSWGSGTSR